MAKNLMNVKEADMYCLFRILLFIAALLLCSCKLPFSDDNDDRAQYYIEEETKIKDDAMIPSLDISALTALYYDGKVNISWVRNVAAVTGEYIRISSNDEALADVNAETSHCLIEGEYAKPGTVFTVNFRGAEYFCTSMDTGIPTIVLDTADGIPIESKETKIDASLILYDKGFATEPWVLTVKGRGNTSWNDMPKKSYSIKFDKKRALFGLPEAKKWVLLANYADRTLLRNRFIGYLGNSVLSDSGSHQWEPHYMPVNLILNGDYLGTYDVAEKIAIGKGRVEIQNIADVEEKLELGKTAKVTDENGDGKKDLYDGGFIMEIDFRLDAMYNFVTKQGATFCLKDPDEPDFGAGKIWEHVKNMIQRTEDVIYSPSYTDLETGWQKLIDMDSIIDWYIVGELAKNVDSPFATSVYIYYNPEIGKLIMGPNWDWDRSTGNCIWWGLDDFKGWHVRLQGVASMG